MKKAEQKEEKPVASTEQSSAPVEETNNPFKGA
jgi:hypothetical protein